MLGVLQTWTRDLRYHPHVHYLVPVLALAPDAKRWLIGNSDFLLHVKPLAKLFRAKVRAAVCQTPWAGQVNARLGQVVGGGLPPGWKWGECLEVSRPLHLPHRTEQ